MQQFIVLTVTRPTFNNVAGRHCHLLQQNVVLAVKSDLLLQPANCMHSTINEWASITSFGFGTQYFMFS
jgi:hypothetical protein